MDVPELSDESIGELYQLLRKWRLEFLLSQFIAEKIDLEVLEMIDTSHITVLLHNYPMGVQIRFAHHLDNWRKSIGKPLRAATFDEFSTKINPKEPYVSYDESHISEASTINISQKTDPLSEVTILSDNDVDSLKCTQLSGSTSSLSLASLPKPMQNGRVKIDLEEILMNSPPNGPDLMQLYGKQKHFTPLDRKRLISTIVNYYLECKLPLDLKTSYELENAIVKMFPNESLQMYRNSRQGKIFTRYAREKTKEMENENCRDLGGNYDESIAADDDNVNAEGGVMSSTVLDDSFVDMLAEEYTEDQESFEQMEHDILIQTVYEGQKKFTKIRSPFLYNSFLTTACELFNITNVTDYCIYLTGCEIEEDRFKNIVMRFYKSPTFTLELRPRSKTFDTEVISNHLPDANYIRNIPSLLPLVNIYDLGKPLQNSHRTIIAKTIIDECLKFNPDRRLKKPDFFTLSDNICKAFHTEVPSTYFLPCRDAKPARGKLWNAYFNKRSILCSSGLLTPRPARKRKRSHCADDYDDGDDEEFEAQKLITESPIFSAHTQLDDDTLASRWKESHKQRRKELTRADMSSRDYMRKYSILQDARGMDLVQMDVNKMYPKMGSMDNWLTLYRKVVEKVRKIRTFRHLPKLIQQIDDSKDTRYRASIALNLLVYIFPYSFRLSKAEVQSSFLKEYKTMDDLTNDGEPTELQLRFVHESHKIVYADFTVCGFIFKFTDLLEALTHCFNYIIALNIEYPKLCQRIWQFIQLAIFEIDVGSGKWPQIESTINDLLCEQKNN